MANCSAVEFRDRVFRFQQLLFWVGSFFWVFDKVELHVLILDRPFGPDNIAILADVEKVLYIADYDLLFSLLCVIWVMLVGSLLIVYYLNGG